MNAYDRAKAAGARAGVVTRKAFAIMCLPLAILVGWVLGWTVALLGITEKPPRAPLSQDFIAKYLRDLHEALPWTDVDNAGNRRCDTYWETSPTDAAVRERMRAVLLTFNAAITTRKGKR